jgi:D-sedoheptulose 7-phosphate isomerase
MTFPQGYKTGLLQAIEAIDLAKVNQAIEWFKDARAAGRHIFVCGNGGSAAIASHFACDIVKGASFNRHSRFRIMALTDQLATLTAYANQLGCRTLALTGRDGGKLGPKAQLNIQVSVPHMGRIEDAHMIVCHMIVYYFVDVEK